ncbi:hypothetical protein, partial [Chryseobacterium tongliaoense]|uniref:hypothetical protein n=1 Tax=Chryseobacterium tongliaoense TaxID=3240933 RepID=UPI003516AEC2
MKNPNKNLKQIIFVLFLLGSILVPAQSEVFQYQKESFLRNYENDYSKGKTDVSVPFLNVPTNKANLAINVGLSYNNDNVSSHGMIGEVGPGWSLSNGGGVITRFFQVGRSDASTIVYQYSFLGKSGRFYIKYKDSSTGGIEVLESYPSKNKISIQTESDRNYFTSFKIVDEKGYKYIFDKKNISYQYEFPDMQSVPLGHQAAGPSAKRELYTSSFYLTKILDEKDNVIVTYEFDVSTASINNGDKQIVRNRVNKINITNVGTINFGYSKGPWNYQDQDKDNFILNNVVLKNKSNQIINQYYLEYIGNRQLYQVTQKDKNNNEIGKYLFSYISRNWGFGSYDKYGFFNGALPCAIENEHKYINNINPYTYDDGFLKSITFPTGGRIEYEYEANTLPIDPYQAQSTSQDFSDFEIDKLFEVNYDTQTANIYPFTINNPSNYSQFVIGTTYEFHDQTGDPHPSFNFDYKLFKQNGDSIQKKNYLNQVDGTVCGIKIFNLENASSNLPLNLRIYGVVYGTAKIYGVRKLSRNYKYSKGGRIKRIKKFENLTSAPSQVLSFDYNLFSDPSKSSGTTYLDSPDYYDSGINPPLMVTADGQDFRSDQEMVIYQNVKVTDSIKNISTRYTYLMPDEVYTLFGNNTDSSFSFDFNGTIKKMGLVKKIEKYDSNNAPVENTNITHTMEYIPFNNLVNNINQPSKILWIKSINTTNQVSVNSSNTLQSSGQKFFESGNNLLIKETSTDFTGSVTESNRYYP